MQWESSVSPWREQVRALNRPFLDLLARCPGGRAGRLGLSADLVAAIAGMDENRRDELAGMPLLLAVVQPRTDGTSLPALAEQVPVVDSWTRDAQVYVAALLTFLWTSIRRADPCSVFLMSQPGELQPWPAKLSVRDISLESLRGPEVLKARFSDCPGFWETLVRTGAGVEADFARLWMIPLAAAERVGRLP